ncbi:MAG TPA: PilZ domain-containing protein [Sphingomicrobium sp.]|nr:PilZ domain-containing protein [Sphingomicrobium sp.]
MATAPAEVRPARKIDRKRVLMRATVFCKDGARVVRIRDLSTEGALIIAEDRLPVGTDVIFKRGPVFAAAQVAWANSASAGLKFYRELDPSDLAPAAAPLASERS